MSDIMLPADNQDPRRTPAGVIEHWCEHPGCRKWGCFGYASGRETPRWFCGDHAPDRRHGT